jgi:uncharacterized RDD family membrane protein YckC
MNDIQQQDLLTETQFQVTYGSFWPRFWALLIDGLIVSVVTPITILNKTEWKSLFVLIIASVIQLSYKPFFEYTYGATAGKMALRLQVVNYKFQKATLEQIITRNIFGILSGLIALAIGIYAFTQPQFLSISSLQQYSQLGYTSRATLIWEGLMFTVVLIDFIFLVSSADSRSLHDRMGKTFVIKT